MNTYKTLAEQTNEVLKSEMNTSQKAKALIKLGVSPYEAMVLAELSLQTPKETNTFTYTFGVEMETVNCDRLDFARAAQEYGIAFIDHMSQYHGCHTDIPQFKLVPDGSLSGHCPAECVTPALNGDETGFKSLKKCCQALKRISATVNGTCGLHVHIGAKDLTDQEYCNVFLNYQKLEKAIDSFMASSRRGDTSRWCHTLTNHNLSYCSSRVSVANELNNDRYHKVNPMSWSRHKTIEFRQHQGTVNFTKIKAWVQFLGKLVEWSKQNRLTEDIDRIENIPFLTDEEKRYFIRRRESLTR